MAEVAKIEKMKVLIGVNNRDTGESRLYEGYFSDNLYVIDSNGNSVLVELNGDFECLLEGETVQKRAERFEMCMSVRDGSGKNDATLLEEGPRHDTVNGGIHAEEVTMSFVYGENANLDAEFCTDDVFKFFVHQTNPLLYKAGTIPQKSLMHTQNAPSTDSGKSIVAIAELPVSDEEQNALEQGRPNFYKSHPEKGLVTPGAEPTKNPWIPVSEQPLLPARPWVQRRRSMFAFGLISGVVLSAIIVAIWALASPSGLCRITSEATRNTQGVPREVCDYFKTRYGTRLNEWHKASDAQIRGCLVQDESLRFELVRDEQDEAEKDSKDELKIDNDVDDLLKKPTGEKEIGKRHIDYKIAGDPLPDVAMRSFDGPKPAEDIKTAPKITPRSTTTLFHPPASPLDPSEPHLGKRWSYRPEEERCWKKNRTATLLALFLGTFGVDQWYAGHYALAVFKMLTLGASGIWSLIDVVLWIVGVYEVSGCGGHTWKY